MQSELLFVTARHLNLIFNPLVYFIIIFFNVWLLGVYLNTLGFCAVV